MDTEAQALRDIIEALSDKKHGRRYSPDLTERIRTYGHRMDAEGLSVFGIHRQLGVGYPTLHKMLKVKRASANSMPREFTQIVVREDLTQSPKRSLRRFDLRGPYGMVVEGMSLDEVAVLLRSLSCSE